MAGWHRSQLVGAILAFVAFGFCTLGIIFLSADARREIQQLATANSDNSQWTLSQAEIELLAFETALREVPLSLTKVRERFDVLYARVSIINNGSVFSDLRAAPKVKTSLSAINAFMQATIEPIDGADADLAAQVPQLLTELPAVRSQMREMTLQGVSQMALQSEQQRQRVASALTRLGVLAFMLFAVLLAVVVMLARIVRLRREQVRQRTQAEQRLKAIVATSLDAIVVANRQGQIVDFNDAAEGIFGYARHEVIGQSMSATIVPHPMRAAHDAGMKRYLETGEETVIGKGRLQLEGMRKSGEVFPIELSISETQGAGGTMFVSYLRDISKRVAKEDELISARDKAVAGEKAKAELMAVMSHEMRTPLNGILGALDLLETTNLDDRQKNLTKIMGTSGHALRHHVNDVLEIARDDAGVTDDVISTFAPVRIVQEVADSLRAAATKNGNALTVDLIGSPSALMVADPYKFRRIITNLIGNAIKFTSQGRVQVECEIDQPSKTLEVRVTDDGIGISEGDIDRIWDDFVTLDPTFSRRQEGTGLGLAIVRRLVDRMGGTVGVESDVGAGSVFWVRFDLAEQSDVSSFPPQAVVDDRSQAQTKLHVLLVEDNEINRFVAKEMLHDLGHSVVEAIDGEDALRVAADQTFDLILMDISMPRMDGVTASRAMRDSGGPNARTPIVALTAHALETDVSRFTQAGMDDVITKPLDRATLRQKLQVINDAENATTSLGDAQVTPEIDEEIVADLIEIVGREKVAQMLAEWSLEMQQLLADAETLPLNDPVKLAHDVHRVAGSAAVLGATGMQQRLAVLETALRSKTGASVEGQWSAIGAAWEQVRQSYLALVNDP